MRKKIISSLLIISLLACLLPLKTFMASENSTEGVPLKIIPTKINSTDVTLNGQVPKTTPAAHPGDTITYTIKVGPVTNLGALQLQLTIPEGLTFNSGQLVDNIENTLNVNKGENPVPGVDFSTFNCDNKRIIIFGADYTSDEYTDIATFTCTVSNDAAEGDYDVEFSEQILGDTATPEPQEIISDVSTLNSTISVTLASQGLIGDINGDGKVNTTDAQLALNIYSGKFKATPTDPNAQGYLPTDNANYISEDMFNEYKQRADVNKDNKVNTTDAQTILNIFSGRLIEKNGELVEPKNS